MADDIDDLLDEVEAAFVRKPEKQKNKTKAVASSIKTKSHLKDDDLNSIMDEICDIPEPDNTPQKRQHVSSQSALLPTGDTKKRCFPVYLAGTSLPEGVTTTANQRACDSLRCTDCDFKISVYRDFKWHPSTDYLFLRNNMPEFSRLKSKLESKPGWKAYACQCKWRSVSKQTELSAEKELKWVCGKHS